FRPREPAGPLRTEELWEVIGRGRGDIDRSRGCEVQLTQLPVGCCCLPAWCKARHHAAGEFDEAEQAKRRRNHRERSKEHNSPRPERIPAPKAKPDPRR